MGWREAGAESERAKKKPSHTATAWKLVTNWLTSLDKATTFRATNAARRKLMSYEFEPPNFAIADKDEVLE